MRYFLAILAILVTSGCVEVREAYKRCPFTPDGLNYTQSVDRKTGDITDYFGASWNMK